MRVHTIGLGISDEDRNLPSGLDAAGPILRLAKSLQSDGEHGPPRRRVRFGIQLAVFVERKYLPSARTVRGKDGRSDAMNLCSSALINDLVGDPNERFNQNLMPFRFHAN